MDTVDKEFERLAKRQRSTIQQTISGVDRFLDKITDYRTRISSLIPRSGTTDDNMQCSIPLNWVSI